MNASYLSELRDFYRRQLLDDILPFWLKYARDRECGGYHTCLKRDGSVYDYDKICMWHAGRIIWTYSYLYNELEQNPDWLEMARCGVEFVQRCGFAPDGELYYSLTRDGKPLQPAQDVYNDLSTVIGFSEFARATGDDKLYAQARDIFLRVWERLGVPGKACQPFNAATRPVRLHGHSLITLGVVQELRRFNQAPECDQWIDECLRALRLHVQPGRRALFEVVGWNGETVPGRLGRWVCPGHMIEAGIFVIHEGLHRDDEELNRLGADLIEWGYERGWDSDFGGIINDVDSEGLPEPTNEAFKHDAKLWWAQAEALYGLLLAHCISGNDDLLAAHDRVKEYAFRKFADPEHGEWFAFLDRRGNCVGTAKGGFRKNCFHIARNFYWCSRLLDAVLAGAFPSLE